MGVYGAGGGRLSGEKQLSDAEARNGLMAPEKGAVGIRRCARAQGWRFARKEYGSVCFCSHAPWSVLIRDHLALKPFSV